MKVRYIVSDVMKHVDCVLGNHYRMLCELLRAFAVLVSMDAPKCTSQPAVKHLQFKMLHIHVIEPSATFSSSFTRSCYKAGHNGYKCNRTPWGLILNGTGLFHWLVTSAV